MLVSGPHAPFADRPWRSRAESADTCLIDRASQGMLIMVQIGPPNSSRLKGIEQ